MPVMDEFRDEREKMKKQPFKKRLSYFWSYHKWHVIGSVVAVVAVILFVRDFMNRTEDVLYGAVVNGYLTQVEDTLSTDFAQYLDIDTTKYSVSLNYSLSLRGGMSDMETSQLLMAYTASGDLDVAFMDTTPFTQYAYSPAFADLRTVLTEEELAALSDRLYYIDYAVSNKIEELSIAGQSTDDVVIPDPKKPEEMEDPMPVGIDVSDCTKFTDVYLYQEWPAYVGILVNSNRSENAVKFVRYLFFEE